MCVCVCVSFSLKVTEASVRSMALTLRMADESTGVGGKKEVKRK